MMSRLGGETVYSHQYIALDDGARMYVFTDGSTWTTAEYAQDDEEQEEEEQEDKEQEQEEQQEEEEEEQEESKGKGKGKGKEKGKGKGKGKAKAKAEAKAKARGRGRRMARARARDRSQVHLNCCWTTRGPGRGSTAGFTIPHVTLPSRRGAPLSRPRLGQGMLQGSMLYHSVSRDTVIW